MMTMPFFSYRFLKILEYIFLAITFMTIAYIGYFFFTKNNRPEYAAATAPVITIRNVTPEEVATSELKPYDFYAQQIENRDLFTISTVPTSVSEANKPLIPEGQLPPNLKVVGIDLGARPLVVIEDTSANKTFFITQESAQEGISIQSVEKKKIFLSYQGQLIEIALKGNQVYGSHATP
jgi:type II secretory pathway component PulC